MVTDSETENQSRERIKIGKSGANVTGTRAQLKRHPRKRTNYEKNTKQNKKGFPR